MKKISVIIPTYNRKQAVLNTAKRLLKQDYPKQKYEIIIVDDGSTDGTYEMLKKIKKIRVFRQKNKGPAAARNAGIKEAKYEIIAFTDDDCLPQKSWLKKIAGYYEKSPDLSGVGGIAYTPLKMIKPLTHHALPLNDAKQNALKFRFPPTCNVSYKKNALIKAGMFHENFNAPTTEDVDLFIRVSKIGKVLFDRNLAMLHSAGKSTVRKQIKRFKDYYRGFEMIEREYPKEFRQIYISESTRKKFTDMSLSFPALKKLLYYKPRYLLNPITFIKLAYLFIATRLFVIKQRFFK